MLNYQSMVNRFFRAGIGTVVYNANGEVGFFERQQHPEGVWQFQQGGIDLGEQLDAALWREVQEEMGLIKTDIELVTERPGWTLYEDVDATTNGDAPKIGQVHHWYFLKLKAEVTIDLTKATDNEFRNWKWISFESAVAATHPNKRHVYQALHEFYVEHIAA